MRRLQNVSTKRFLALTFWLLGDARSSKNGIQLNVMWNNSLLSKKQTGKENIDLLISIPVAAMPRAMTSVSSVEIKEGIFYRRSWKRRKTAEQSKISFIAKQNKSIWFAIGKY